MAKTPDYMHVRPLMIDVGRGPELYRGSFRRGDLKWFLPEKGGKVPARRREGSFWLARIAEGCVERFDPKSGESLLPNGKKPKAKPAAKTPKD